MTLIWLCVSTNSVTDLLLDIERNYNGFRSAPLLFQSITVQIGTAVTSIFDSLAMLRPVKMLRQLGLLNPTHSRDALTLPFETSVSVTSIFIVIFSFQRANFLVSTSQTQSNLWRFFFSPVHTINFLIIVFANSMLQVYLPYMQKARMHIWLVCAFLACPSLILNDRGLDALKYALSDQYYLQLYRDDVLDIHEIFKYIFKTTDK
jgi:hypothetical protein